MNVILYNTESKLLEFVSDDEVLSKLYFSDISHMQFPTRSKIEKYLETHNDNITSFFKDIDDGIQLIKENISKIDNKIPLYDIHTENLYIIPNTEIYDCVINKQFRFPDKKLLFSLQEKKVDIEQEIQQLKQLSDKAEKELTNGKNITDINKKYSLPFQKTRILSRTKWKIELCLQFMDAFDLDILFNTYTRALYLYSSKLGKEITICQRPSYSPSLTHIKPYYSKSEVTKMATNTNIIPATHVVSSRTELQKLCKNIRENDISYKVLIEHQIHIIKNKMIGLVQHYSMHGSYFMNQYLRGQSSYKSQNEYLETQIKLIWYLINTSPPFDKDYILYRFVATDEFVSQLKIGDIFTEKGFMSTTRDPFYKNDNYKFGWILMKIKLPKSISGCALCIETISQFQNEQEIILPPNTQFKLINKDNNCTYLHTDDNIGRMIKTKYEFEVVGKSEIILPIRLPTTEPLKHIDFLTLPKISSLTVSEKIQSFMKRYVNEMGLFEVTIGDDICVLKAEWYDSTNAYKPFYSIVSKNGFSIYYIHKNHVAFMIELGEEQGTPYMCVNYYMKHSTLDKDRTLGTDQYITFLATIAYHFDIPIVTLYADYLSCDYLGQIDEDNIYTRFYGGTYCADMYQYLKNGIKKYSNIGVTALEMKPVFTYHMLDQLKNIRADTIIKKDDILGLDDRVYQIYTKIYKQYEPEINHNLAKFYTWYVENYCYSLPDLLKKFEKIPEYKQSNPFKYDYYHFYAISFLYNRGKISSLPSDLNYMTMEQLIMKTQTTNINRYRTPTSTQRIFDGIVTS